MNEIERELSDMQKQSSKGIDARGFGAQVAVEIAARSLEEKGDRLCDPDCARAMRAIARYLRANANLFAVTDHRHRFPAPTD